MSFVGLLRHRCDVDARSDSEDLDDHGNQVDVESVTVGVACRVSAVGGDEKDGSVLAVAATHKVYFDAGQALDEGDALLNGADEDGTVLFAAAEVKLVKKIIGMGSVHHLMAAVLEVRGG